MATNFVSKEKYQSCAIFAIFTPYERVLGVDYRSDIFSISQETLPWQPFFVSYRTWSIGAEVSQDTLDRFSQSLHRMVGTELQNCR